MKPKSNYKASYMYRNALIQLGTVLVQLKATVQNNFNLASSMTCISINLNYLQILLCFEEVTKYHTFFFVHST